MRDYVLTINREAITAAAGEDWYRQVVQKRLNEGIAAKEFFRYHVGEDRETGNPQVRITNAPTKLEATGFLPDVPAEAYELKQAG